MRRWIVLSGVVALGASLAHGTITVTDPAWLPATLYYQSEGLVPDKMNWGFDGNLYVGNAISDFGVSIWQVTGPGVGASYGAPLTDPDAVLQLADGSVLVGGANSVTRIPPGPGAPVLVTAALNFLHAPSHLALAPNGDVLADDGNRVVRINPDGTVTDVITNLTDAGAIAFDGAGNLYFANAARTGISSILYNPLGPAVDATGVATFIAGFNSINSIDFMSDSRLLFSDRTATVNDALWFGTLAGATSQLAIVAPVGAPTLAHSFAAYEGPDGAIYVSDGTAGEAAIFRIPQVPEPASFALLALVGGALIRRR